MSDITSDCLNCCSLAFRFVVEGIKKVIFQQHFNVEIELYQPVLPSCTDRRESLLYIAQLYTY